MNETHLTIERLICLKNLQKNLDYSTKKKRKNKIIIEDTHTHIYK